MKEIVFINTNAKKWKQFEKNISLSNIANPDELTEMYNQLTDDLAYARTYYPESKTEFYLNNLARQLHAIIYKTKKERHNRFLLFWKYEFPLEIYKMRKYIAWSLVFFLFAAFIGAVSAQGDEEFVRLILGDYYVDMTIENIEKGEPMAVYASTSQMEMFVLIALNNIKVAILSFLVGILSYFGTGAILFSNGVMLGSFQYFFYKYNLLYESVLSIWIHGTIEIFAIIVSGAAGLLMGSSFLFPGTYSRKTAFMRAAKRGAKIIFGIIPFIILAAFLEAYATRHTEWHEFTRIGIIGSSLLIIILYFVVYPFYLKRKLETDAEFYEFYHSLGD